MGGINNNMACLRSIVSAATDDRRPYAEPAAGAALESLLGFVFDAPSAVMLPGRSRLIYGERAAAALRESRREAETAGDHASAGLILVHAYDQQPAAFRLYARALVWAARGSPLLTNASLLLATSNSALLRHGQSEPGHWLDHFRFLH